jgi:hypothetical protein
MKTSARCLIVLQFVFAGIASADINTTFLPERPSATVALALTKAARETKAVFVILYDDRETAPNTLQFFFDSSLVKQQFKQNFEVCVRDRRKSDVAQYDEPTHAWNRARFVVLTPAGGLLHQGRLLRNDEAGVTEVAEAVAKWQAVKKQFETKPASGGSQLPRRP